MYKSSWDCYKKTVRRDGIRGLWVGWSVNVCRNSIISATELASYDQFKQLALGLGAPDRLHTHIACAFLTGLVVVCVGSPVDVLKTRVMNRKTGGSESIPQLVAKMITKEGPLAFYKGFTANWWRQGSWMCVFFISLE